MIKNSLGRYFGDGKQESIVGNKFILGEVKGSGANQYDSAALYKDGENLGVGNLMSLAVNRIANYKQLLVISWSGYISNGNGNTLNIYWYLNVKDGSSKTYSLQAAIAFPYVSRQAAWSQSIVLDPPLASTWTIESYFGVPGGGALSITQNLLSASINKMII